MAGGGHVANRLLSMTRGLTVLLFAIVGVECAEGQAELTPEPGLLAQISGYELDLREMFDEAYSKGVILRAVKLPPFAPEMILFINQRHEVVVLSPKETGDWRIHQAGGEDAEGGSYPGKDDDSDDRALQSVAGTRGRNAGSRVELERRSRPISDFAVENLREVWEDALVHAKHEEKPRLTFEGTRWHYSLWVQGRGVLSGMVWSPERDTISSALNDVFGVMAAYAASEADIASVLRATQDYKLVRRARENESLNNETEPESN